MIKPTKIKPWRFRKTLYRIAESDSFSCDPFFWSFLLSYKPSNFDLYETVTSSDIKSIRDRNPNNFVVFIREVSFKLVAATRFHQYHEVPMWTRILSRFLPFLFEATHVDYQYLFWSRSSSYRGLEIQPQSADADVGSELSASSFSDQDVSSLTVNIFNKDRKSSLDSTKAVINHSNRYSRFELPLGAQLIRTCIDLLFVSEFTIPSTALHSSVNRPEFVLWEPGIGQNGTFNNEHESQINTRTEILRLLIVLCSEPVYETDKCVVGQGSKFITTLVTATDRLQLVTMVDSLINFVLKYQRPITVITPQGNLLYNYSLCFLAVLLTYPIPNDNSFLTKLSVIGPANANHNSQTPENLVRLYLSELHKPSEYSYITSNFLNTLSSNSCNASLKYPESPPTAIIMILWDLLQCNNKFKRFIINCKSKDTGDYYSNELCVCMFSHMFTYSDKDANLARVSSHFLLYMTSIPSMALRLLQKINQKVLDRHIDHLDINTNSDRISSYRDLIVYNITIMLIGQRYLHHFPLISVCLECLYNLIPIACVHGPQVAKIEGLSYKCCTILVQLMVKLSSPANLTYEQIMPDILSLLIRSLANAVAKAARNLHQIQHLLRALVKYEKSFTRVLDNVNGLLETDRLNVAIELSNFSSSSSSLNSLVSHDSAASAQSSNASINHFQATRPPGMSRKAKSKLPIDASLSRTWSGFDHLNFLLNAIEFLKKQLPENVEPNFANDSTKLAKVQINKIQGINSIPQFIPLKFVWSKYSLGWYLGVIWKVISKIDQYGKPLSVNDNVKSISSALSKFGLFANTNYDKKESKSSDTFINNGLLENTAIKLFKIKYESKEESEESENESWIWYR